MLNSGFFNSKNHDKKYYPSDFSRLFNALIMDGIFENVGDQFTVVAGEGMQVIVRSGMAYCNSTWTYNDSDYIVDLEPAPYENRLVRIDGIFLRSFPETSTGHRDNEIYYAKGEQLYDGSVANNDYDYFIPESEENEVFMPLCYIMIASGITEINQQFIINMVGKKETPFITGILQHASIENIFEQWQTAFNEWLNNRSRELQRALNNIDAALDAGTGSYLMMMKQNKEDENLTTDNKNVVNAINELDEHLTATKGNSKYKFQFAVDGDGTFGFREADGSFTPFNSLRDMPYYLGNFSSPGTIDISLINANPTAEDFCFICDNDIGVSKGATNGQNYATGYTKFLPATFRVTDGKLHFSPPIEEIYNNNSAGYSMKYIQGDIYYGAKEIYSGSESTAFDVDSLSPISKEQFAIFEIEETRSPSGSYTTSQNYGSFTAQYTKGTIILDDGRLGFVPPTTSGLKKTKNIKSKVMYLGKGVQFFPLPD